MNTTMHRTESEMEQITKHQYMYIHVQWIPLNNTMQYANRYTYIHAQHLPIQMQSVKSQNFVARAIGTLSTCSQIVKVRGIHYNVMCSVSTGGNGYHNEVSSIC